MSSKPNNEATTRSPAAGTRRSFLLKAATVATAVGGNSIGDLSLSATVNAASGRRSESCLNLNAPMKEVRGKVAFISGGSSGIGLGIAQAFTEAGMRVVIGYLTKEHSENAMISLANAGDRVHAIHVDVTDRSGMEEAAAETIRVFGKVHVLVNNAGVGVIRPFERTTYSDWDWVIGVNLTGVFNGIHAFLPCIQQHGEGGQIISISSTAGLFAIPGLGAYTASKFGVVGMMECLRAELDNTNIGASVCCPDGVRTNIVNADRNRAKELASVENTLAMEGIKKSYEKSDLVMDPQEIGALVLRGMRRNDLYILTHPEFDAMVRARQELLSASVPADLRPTSARVKDAREAVKQSIYVSERVRERCGRPEHYERPMRRNR